MVTVETVGQNDEWQVANCAMDSHLQIATRHSQFTSYRYVRFLSGHVSTASLQWYQ